MAQKILNMLLQFCGKGSVIGAVSYLWCSSDFWRKHRVKRAILSQKRLPLWDLPKFERESITTNIIDALKSCDPLLIDGPSGAGKTCAIREVCAILSRQEDKDQYGDPCNPIVSSKAKKKHGVLYLNLRTVNTDQMTVSLAKQFGYIGKGAKHDNVDQALDCLREAIYELKLKKGIKTKIFVDEIDRAFGYGEKTTTLGKSLVAELGLRLSDLRAGKTIFVTSDNFVFGEMRKINGVDKRLEYFHFPTVTESTYLNYIKENKEHFKKFTPDPEKDFDKFYQVFGTNLRSIGNFIKTGKPMESIFFYANKYSFH